MISWHPFNEVFRLNSSSLPHSAHVRSQSKLSNYLVQALYNYFLGLTECTCAFKRQNGEHFQLLGLGKEYKETFSHLYCSTAREVSVRLRIFCDGNYSAGGSKLPEVPSQLTSSFFVKR
jgi:hypothetical protein